VAVSKTGLTAEARRTQKNYMFYPIFPLLFLFGCANIETVFIPAKPSFEKDSIVYIYRSDSFSNVVISPVLLIDNVERLPVRSARYTYVYLVPGSHEFKLNLDKHYHGIKELIVDIKHNKTYFLRIDSSMEFRAGERYKRTFNIREISKEIGENEIKECRYVKPAMPSKYLFGDNNSGGGLGNQQDESVFSIEKMHDPFKRR